MKQATRVALDIILYVIVFVLIQAVMGIVVAVIASWIGGWSWSAIGDMVMHGGMNLNSKMLVIVSALSSVLTLCWFIKAKWAFVSKSWLKSHQWSVLFWSAIASLGTLMPSEWLSEMMPVDMPESMLKSMTGMLKEPMLGYLAACILAPVAEELVFRGAILRSLLNVLGGKRHWIAIAISAVIFGLVHGNVPQFIHAMLIGLLLGWMYYRTNSIIPGIMFHWVNNTVAYLAVNLLPPEMSEGNLTVLFGGNNNAVVLSVIFSLFILIPAIYQLAIRMHGAEKA